MIADTLSAKRLLKSDSRRVRFQWDPEQADPSLYLYRKQTTALLRRYGRMSVEVGRLPSLVGREIFRSKVASCKSKSFEDAVIFVHDVEHVLEQLDDLGRELIATIVLEYYTQDEAAKLLGLWRSQVSRQFPQALDFLSERFLQGGLLQGESGMAQIRKPPQPCQEAREEVCCLSV